MKIIFDTNNIIHLSLYASGINEENYDDKDIQGLFYHNFLNKINRYMEIYNPKNLFFIFDSPTGSSYRKSIYPAYKQNRKKGSKVFDTLYKTLIPTIKQLLDLYPVNVFSHEKGEGDDCIYNLCKLFETEEIEVVSSDGDLKQLLLYFNNLKLYHPIKKHYIEKPDGNFVKLKAIVGDTSDNIIGVYKVGEKTAQSYLDGERFFNDIQKEQFELALKIVDLSIYKYNDIIQEDIKKYLKEKKYKFNPDRIEMFLLENKMKQIYNKWNELKEVVLKYEN